MAKIIFKKYVFILFVIWFSNQSYSQQNDYETANYYHDLAINQLTQNNLDDALLNIDKSIYLNSNKASSHYIKGVIYEKKMLFAVAIENFEKAIALDPYNSNFYSNLAAVYGKINDTTNLCYYLSKACNLGNNKACETFKKICNIQTEYNKQNLSEHHSNEDIINRLQEKYSNQSVGSSKYSIENKGGLMDTYREPKNFSTTYTDRTIKDSHVQLEDGSWKPKYKTYSVNRDNDAVPGNRINYDNNVDNYDKLIGNYTNSHTNTSSKDSSIWILIIFSLTFMFLVYYFIIHRKKTKNNHYDQQKVFNSEEGEKTALTKPISSVLYFYNYKFTEDFFYKNNETTVKINPDTIEVNCFPILGYGGTYYITKVMQNKTFNITRFLVKHRDSDIGIEYTIDIEKQGKKISIYKQDLQGIIFKF